MLSVPSSRRVKPWLTAVAVLMFAACGGSDDPPTGSTGDFTFSLTPTALSLVQGQSGQVTAALTRTGGFAGAVAGTVEGVPAGVTLTPLAIPAGSTSAPITVSVGATVAAGVYPITIRANATGIAQKTLTVTLTVTAAATPTLAIAVNPTTVPVQAGSQGSSQATITRGGGFAGAVTLAVTGAPAGMIVTPPAIAVGATTSAITVDVGAAVAAGTYPLIVRATGTAVAEATATLTVTVTAAPVPTVAIAIVPTAITVAANGQGTSQATIIRGGGFTGAVTLSVTGAPVGVSTTSPTIAVGATTSTITIQVGAAVAPGAYPLTVRATGAGVTEASTVLTLTVGAAADYTVALAPSTLTIAPAAQSNSTINITRSGGFAGSLTFALQAAAPAGITVTLPGPVAGNSATITVAVGAQVAAGNYPITINVTGTGVPAKSVVLTVTVSSLGSFTLAANPAAIAITQGQTAQTTVSIARVAPHVAPVTLSVTGLPTGVSFQLNPGNPVAGTTTTITFTATAGATLGAGSASITGTGGGVTSPAITVPITVQASGGGGAGNVSFNFCTLSGIPVFLAFQDGLGAWTRANPNASNTYNFTINSPRGGVAYVMGAGGSTELEVNFGSVAELNAIGSSDCDGTPASGRTINGSVTGIGVDDFVFISGGGATSVATLNPPNFSLQNVKPGPFDLIAAQFPDVGTGKFILRRNLNPPNATALPVLDFAGPEAFNPISRTVTINNALGQNLSLIGLYVLQGGQQGVPFFFDEESLNPVRNWLGVPTDRQAVGDFHFMLASATNGTPSTESRQFGRVFRDAANQTFTLPAVLSSTSVSTLPAAGGNSRLRAVYTPQVDYLSQWSVSYSQVGNGGVSVSITVTAAYTGGGTVTLDVPDLTPLAGWNTNWGLKPGFSTVWDFSANGWSASFNVTSSALVEGAEFRFAQREGTITP